MTFIWPTLHDITISSNAPVMCQRQNFWHRAQTYPRGSVILTFEELHCVFSFLHESEDLVLLDFLLLLNRHNLDENELLLNCSNLVLLKCQF